MNQFAREAARSKGLNVVEDTINLPNIKFDIIYLNHVLEHILELDEMIDQILCRLNKNGHLIIGVPNSNSFLAKKINWIGFQVEQHFWHFTPNTLSALMKKYGLKEELYTLSTPFWQFLRIEGDNLIAVYKLEK